MHFGEVVSEERYVEAMRLAWESGVRTFVSADVYGLGKADQLLGEALAGIDREEYCLVGMVGHDIYEGVRQGSKGYPRFTDPGLRGESGYADYLEMATVKSLERCRADRFDYVLLHNPDSVGYSSEVVWRGMERLREAGLTRKLGVAPGPANGFVPDLAAAFAKFSGLIDLAMVILNPLEPWPNRELLPVARRHGVSLLARVVDHGGIFHDNIQPGHEFRPGDHRAFRPQGWVEEACLRRERMRPLAERYGLTMLQMAALACLSRDPVAGVVPTMIQEPGMDGKSLEDLIREFAATPAQVKFTEAELAWLDEIGDNTGKMLLKGASDRHAPEMEPRADEWPLTPALAEVCLANGIGAY